MQQSKINNKLQNAPDVDKGEFRTDIKNKTLQTNR